MTVHDFNSLGPLEARGIMLDVCGARAWAERMVYARPYATVVDVLSHAERFWVQMRPDDWREAFAAHPRIGERSDKKFSQQEQTLTEDSAIANELARLNDEYYEKNGFIFIVFASGKTPLEMLEILRQRIRNEANVEMSIAASEQWRIMELRLKKLFQ